MSGGYRDRVLTELAQNAADAATRAGVPGRVAVWTDGADLHVANVGAPLALSGVHALGALRASDKADGAVGRYGVGFTAVRSIGDRVEFRSRTGSIVFDLDRTREELAARGIAGTEAPVLRLAWPIYAPPAAGWDSEIVVRVRGDVEGLVSGFAAEAVDLLLELPALVSISVRDDEFARVSTPLFGETVDEVVIGDRTWWQGTTATSRWLLPVVGGMPAPVRGDVLRAPTRSDEETSLPLIVVTSVALQPDRRRVLPDTSLAHVADGYAEIVRALPAEHRLAMIPRPTLAAGSVDSVLREHVLRELRGHPWVPTATDVDVVPSEAMVLPGASDGLVKVLADVVAGLVPASISAPYRVALLASVGVHVLGPARVTEMLSGLVREPSWWHRVYTEMDLLLHDSAAVEECAAMPVPLTDGRTVTGPRTVVFLGDDGTGEPVGDVSWARVVHPQAMHPLLQRLGAQEARAVDVLSDPALEAILDDPDGVADGIVTDVLMLARRVGTPIPTLGSLPLLDSEGDTRAADELLLRGSPLESVMSEDAPFGIVADEIVDRFGVDALRTVGVLSAFAVVSDDLPTGPDHDLDDEERWWDSLADEPSSVVAVRDLDLVDENAWATALTVLLTDPVSAAAVGDRDGYTAWWLRRHATLAGTPLGLLRAHDDSTFAGLLDVIDHPDAAKMSTVLAPPEVDDIDLARALLERLADEDRSVVAAVTISTHARLAAAVESGRVLVTDVDPPEFVRSVAGTVCSPRDAMVLDRPWLAAVVDQARLVVGSVDTAEALADLLDVEVASSVVVAHVVGAGAVVRVDEQPRLAMLEALSGLRFPARAVTAHDRLTVRVQDPGGGDRDVTVPFWVDESDTVHVSRALWS